MRPCRAQNALIDDTGRLQQQHAKAKTIPMQLKSISRKYLQKHQMFAAQAASLTPTVFLQRGTKVDAT